MSRYEWILLDLDGTLFDFDQAQRAAFRATMAELDVDAPEDSFARYTRINHEAWQQLEQGELNAAEVRTVRFERLFAEIAIDLDPGCAGSRFLEHLGEQTVLIPEAEETVRALSEHARLVLATNGFAGVQRSRLARSPITPWLHDVIISEEVGAAKPDAAYFEAAFSRMGHPDRSKVLMVGDSLSSDIAGGAGYGIDTCWFNPGGADERPIGSLRTDRARLDRGQTDLGGTDPNGVPCPTYEIRRLSHLPGIVAP